MTITNSAIPVELVLFDCDGVLVDSERIAVRVQVGIGAELGWPLTADEVIERFIGRSTASIGEQVAERLGAEVAAEWQARFEERHRVAVEEELAPVAGIEQALAELRLPSCVASSGSHEKMRHTLGRTGLYEYFAGRIFSATEVPQGKPAPTSSCTRRGGWACGRRPAWWSRTAPTGCGRRGPPGCGCSATRAD